MLSVLVTETAINEVGKHNLFNQLQKKLNKKNIEFKIVTFKSLESNEVYSYRGLNVDIIKTKKYKSKLLNYLKIFLELVKLKPDHLTIGGYGYVQNWIALIYSIIFNKKKTIWTGASDTTTLNKNNLALHYIKSIFVKRFDNSIVYGSKAKKYLEKLEFSKKIFLTKNISDVEFFFEKKPYNVDILKKNKKKLNFIFCARLLSYKGLNHLINTFKKLDKQKYFLTIVGDGPLKKNVIRNIQSKKINAKYFNKLDQYSLANQFKKSDIFISTTLNDPFTRTLSEAISAKCFCLSSIYDDASHDLINRNNGIIYDPKKYNCLFYILQKILKNPHLFHNNLININLKKYNTDVYSSVFAKSILETIYE